MCEDMLFCSKVYVVIKLPVKRRHCFKQTSSSSLQFGLELGAAKERPRIDCDWCWLASRS